MPQPDPGGQFESEFHRRACALCPHPDESRLKIDGLARRLAGDTSFPVNPDQLKSYLNDLVDSGEVGVDQSGGYRQTKQGNEKLTGPALVHYDPESDEMVEPPPMEGERLKMAQRDSERITKDAEARAAASRIAAREQAEKEAAEQLKSDEAALKAVDNGEELLGEARSYVEQRAKEQRQAIAQQVGEQ